MMSFVPDAPSSSSGGRCQCYEALESNTTTTPTKPHTPQEEREDIDNNLTGPRVVLSSDESDPRIGGQLGSSSVMGEDLSDSHCCELHDASCTYSSPRCFRQQESTPRLDRTKSILKSVSILDEPVKHNRKVTFSECTADFELLPKPKPFFPLSANTTTAMTSGSFSTTNLLGMEAPSSAPTLLSYFPHDGVSRPNATSTPVKQPMPLLSYSPSPAPSSAGEADDATSPSGVNTFLDPTRNHVPVAVAIGLYEGCHLSKPKEEKEEETSTTTAENTCTDPTHSSPPPTRHGLVFTNSPVAIAEGSTPSSSTTVSISSHEGHDQKTVFDLAATHSLDAIFDQFYLSA